MHAGAKDGSQSSSDEDASGSPGRDTTGSSHHYAGGAVGQCALGTVVSTDRVRGVQQSRLARRSATYARSHNREELRRRLVSAQRPTARSQGAERQSSPNVHSILGGWIRFHTGSRRRGRSDVVGRARGPDTREDGDLRHHEQSQARLRRLRRGDPSPGADPHHYFRRVGLAELSYSPSRVFGSASYAKPLTKGENASGEEGSAASAICTIAKESHGLCRDSTLPTRGVANYFRVRAVRDSLFVRAGASRSGASAGPA